VIFLSAIFLFLTRPLFCPPQRDEWTAKTYSYSAPSYYGAEEHGHIVAKKTSESEQRNSNSDNKLKNYVLEISCSEFKFTDFALVIFTYCLVIVGWFAMRHTDETTRRSERAYIIGGGPYGLPKTHYRPGEQWKHWAEATHFKEPRRMTIQNYGKTPGFITSVEYGLCPRDKWPKGMSVSEAMRLDSFRDEFVGPPCPHTQEPIQPNTEWLPYRHVEFRRDENIGNIFLEEFVTLMYLRSGTTRLSNF